MSDLREAALELAKQGVRVFPVGADKAPRTPNGFHDATDRADVVNAWEWNSGAMIGATIAPGTVVIDVDPRNGGNQTIQALREAGHVLPSTRVVRTQSGGFHYTFSVPEGVTLRARLGPGVDVKRAGKGYVVVPPSSGYLLFDGQLPAAAPQWLLDELVVTETERNAAQPGDAKFFPWEDGTAYGIAALEREIGRLAAAPAGERNNALNRAAFALSQLVAGGEIDRDITAEDLARVASRIGLDAKEAESTIASGWKAGELEPRQAKPRDPEAFGEDAEAERPSVLGKERFWVDWDIDEPALPFFLHPIIPKNAYVLVYGATEASKSMVFMALCAEASHRGVRTSFYSLENPPATDRDRLRRLRPHRANFRLTNEPLDVNDPRQLTAMVEREKEWGTDIVVIDTYSHAFNSRSDDGNAKAIEFARRMRYLMHEVDCSVVVVDHTGYMQQEEPRDASAKRQQIDVGVLMRKSGEWQPGKPSRFTMKCTKSARFANPFFLTGEIRDVKETHGLELGWLCDPPQWEDT